MRIREKLALQMKQAFFNEIVLILFKKSRDYWQNSAKIENGNTISYLNVLRSGEMFFFYPMLIIGALLGIGAVIALLAMYKDKNYTLMRFGKSIASLLIGFLLLYMTLPSLKYVVFKEYDVVRGKCVIEIDSATRSSTVDFTMLESDEIFSFRDIPDLDAYGKAVPYYCEVTVTKDHMFEVGYKLYDDKTRKLLETSD